MELVPICCPDWSANRNDRRFYAMRKQLLYGAFRPVCVCFIDAKTVWSCLLQVEAYPTAAVEPSSQHRDEDAYLAAILVTRPMLMPFMEGCSRQGKPRLEDYSDKEAKGRLGQLATGRKH